MKTKIFEEGKIYIFTDKYYKNQTIFEKDLDFKRGKPLRVIKENDFSVLVETYDGKNIELEKKMLSDDAIEKLPNKFFIIIHILLFGLHKIKFLIIAFICGIPVASYFLLYMFSTEIQYMSITEKTYLLSEKNFRKELQFLLDKTER